MKRSVLPYVIAAAVLVFLYLPIVILVANSFNASRFGGSWEGFSLRWYLRLREQREIWYALRNTLVVAFAATIISTVLGTTAALALHGWGTRLQRVHYALIYTPLVVPDVLIGISLLLLFVALGVRLGLGTILLAHVSFCISYVTMVVLSRLQDFDASLLEAARDLGANSWQAMRLVLLPLLMPGIAAGGLLAFTLSIDDFVISFFVSGPGSTTLPIRIYSMIKHGSPPLINALSTLLIVVTFSAVWVAQMLSKERRSER
ncbi:MAG: ABC transporter permease subunit [Lentisphaeria bacterium]|nr:ABC transporter permease subunit [Lentisphaeria bacterium]